LSYGVFLDDNLISWSSKRQNVISRLRAEAEYRVMTNVLVVAWWLRQLLLELHNPLSWVTLVYCDNVSAVYLSNNSIQHQRSKHVDIDLHFVHEHVTVGDVCDLHVPMTS
jgi:hypothetical protein